MNKQYQNSFEVKLFRLNLSHSTSSEKKNKNISIHPTPIKALLFTHFYSGNQIKIMEIISK